MPGVHVSRGTLLAALVGGCLVLVSLGVVSQAIAARRAWGSRLRPVHRAPSNPTPQVVVPSAPTGVPTPALRPEPDPSPGPVTLYDEWLPEAPAAVSDQATVLQEILEIRRRLRVDPSFRDVGGGETPGPLPVWDHEETSEAAFRHALESLSSGDAEWTVRKKSSGGDCEMKYRVTNVAEAAHREETTVSAAASLRVAARTLESRANAFEDADAFDRAEELREMARQLRAEAGRAK